MAKESEQGNLTHNKKTAKSAAANNSFDKDIAQYWLSALIDSADDAIISKTLEGIITSWNKAATRIFGYSATEAIGKPILILLPPDRRSEEKQILEKIKAGERVEHFETVRMRKDGSLIDISLTVSPIKDDKGNIIGASKIAREITEIKKTAVQLRSSEERYRTLFNSIDEGFCVIELIFDETGSPIDWIFTEVNPAFEKHNGLVNAVGKTARELIPGIEEHWFQIYGKVVLTGEAVRFEEGSEALRRWFDVYAFRIGEREDRKVAVLFNDSTNRKQTEEELRKSDARLRLALDIAETSTLKETRR
jgi:PAS domain S-box-containing protein